MAAFHSDRTGLPNISVIVGDVGSAAGGTSKHLLYVQHQLVASLGNTTSLVDGVLSAIAELALPAPPDCLALKATTVLGPDGKATLVDRRLSDQLLRATPRLRRLGYTVLSNREVAVRPDSCTVDVIESDRFASSAGSVALQRAAIVRETAIGRIVSGVAERMNSSADKVSQLTWLVQDTYGAVTTASVERLVPLCPVSSGAAYGKRDGLLTALLA